MATSGKVTLELSRGRGELLLKFVGNTALSEDCQGWSFSYVEKKNHILHSERLKTKHKLIFVSLFKLVELSVGGL